MAPDAAVLLLGLGSWMKGFRSLPWMSIRFFLKDGLGLHPFTLQLLLNTAEIPMVAKPLYGVVSDAVYIRGAHRLPYIAIGVTLQAVTWMLIAFLPTSSMNIWTLSIFLLVGNLGAAIDEVANQALVAEVGKQMTPHGRLESVIWMFYSCGGFLGYLFGAVAVNKFSPRVTFLLFSLLLILQLIVTATVDEMSLSLYKNKSVSSSASSISLFVHGHALRSQFILSTEAIVPSYHSHSRRPSSKFLSILAQFDKLVSVLTKKEVYHEIFSFAASSAIIPSLAITMFYYQSQFLKLDPSVYSICKVFKKGFVLVWSVSYSKWLKGVSPARLLSILQGLIALFMISDALFVTGFYRDMGVSDSIYVIVFSGFSEALMQFPLLPFSVLIAQICPSGCEGSLMAFSLSAATISNIISGYFGIALVSYMGISSDDYSRLTSAILAQAALTVLPLYW